MGDVAQARQLFEGSGIFNRPQRPNEMVVVGYYHVLVGDFKKAAAVFGPLAQQGDAGDLMLIVGVLRDSLGQPAERDQAFQAVPAADSFKQVSNFFAAAAQKGDKAAANLEAADKLFKSLNDHDRPLTGLLMGLFLEKRGQTAAARDYYERCLASLGRSNSFRAAVAAHRFRDLKETK